MLGPFTTASRLTPIHQVSPAVLSCAACASMSTTPTTMRDRGDRYGPMEWAQWVLLHYLKKQKYRNCIFLLKFCVTASLGYTHIQRHIHSWYGAHHPYLGFT